MGTIYKGADEQINITLTDDEGALIPISSCVNIIVSIYQTKGEVIQQFQLADLSLKVVDNNGVVQANLDRDNTIHLKAKRLYLQVSLAIENDAFESGVMNLIKSDIPLADLKESV